MSVEIIVNGRPHEAAGETSVASLLEQMNLSPRQVAVEVNRRLVPRGRHAETVLAEGDRLEIVTLVGGG